MAKPNLMISVGDDGLISMKSESTFKTTEIKFKLDEEFEETTADGRKTKVGHLSLQTEKRSYLVSFLTAHCGFQTVITLENGKLVQRQTWEGKQTMLEREIQEGKLTAVSIELTQYVSRWHIHLHPSLELHYSSLQF